MTTNEEAIKNIGLCIVALEEEPVEGLAHNHQWGFAGRCRCPAVIMGAMLGVPIERETAGLTDVILPSEDSLATIAAKIGSPTGWLWENVIHAYDRAYDGACMTSFTADEAADMARKAVIAKLEARRGILAGARS